MELKSKEILCIGEVLWDKFPGNAKPGGAPMNVALHLQRQGQKVTLASRIGSDNMGAKLTNFLKRNGLNTEFVQVDPQLPTSEVEVTLDENNNATYNIKEPVAWDRLEQSNRLIEKARNAGIFIYGSLASRDEISRQTIYELLKYDFVKVIDVNLRPPYDNQSTAEKLIEKADIVKLNEEELYKITGWHNVNSHDEKELMKWVSLQYNTDILVVTHGAKGAVVYDGATFYQHPGYKVKTIDNVGAGDAFIAGFIAELIKNAPIKQALDFACAAGAFVASQKGATPDYDTTDIESIIANK
ncbi:MAG: carbohydrate kinase [Bacteroidales bacterium]|nr:carbohydrate kinase [Bacteroidales bacterium]MCF8336653.1 carbohydrate kinase [Bacteroidales bacterium]